MCDVYSDVSGNEWRTRFETQIELNGQLERQISLIHERLEDLRGNPMGKFTGVCYFCSTRFLSNSLVYYIQAHIILTHSLVFTDRLAFIRGYDDMPIVSALSALVVLF